jgi:hypothetical protein
MDSMEPFRYRAWKWVVQRITAHRTPTQHTQLNEIDWDVLIVLDACRHDVLSEVAQWPIGSAITPETSTGRWLPKMKEYNVFDGAHVVAANSQYAKLDVGAANVEGVWDSAWNSDLGNAPPEPVFDTVDDHIADGRTPVVGHTLPPHAPYVGKLDTEWIPLQPELDIMHGWDTADNAANMSWQAAMARGAVPAEEARRAYQTSVASVWDSLEPYLARWVRDGLEVVVTADHGEVFGHYRDFWLYEHPAGCFVEPLCKVPFIHFPGDWHADVDPRSVDEHLRALGYRE